MNSKLKVFITGDHPWIRRALADDGFAVLDRSGLLPGENQIHALQAADCVLLVWVEGGSDPSSIESWPTDLEISAWERSEGVYGIPVMVGHVSPLFLPESVAELKPIELKRPESGAETEVHNRSALLSALRRLSTKLNGFSAAPTFRRKPALTGYPLKLVEIGLANIGCFQSLVLPLDCDWTTILGDNAAGKSTLLRSIALGLCTESEAAALIKDRLLPVLRHGAAEGEIRLELTAPDTGQVFSITTKIEVGPAKDEKVRKETNPPEDLFPWDRLFVCGYGTNRSLRATKSYEEYSTYSAVRSLFDESLPLHNPETVLNRRENGLRTSLERRLLEILMLENCRFEYSERGVAIEGAWGKHSIQALSDGYRSTLQWVADFCAWAIHAERFGNESPIGGVLLIDELEQHLHPRWQRHIVKRLSDQFPGTQFVVSTHTPLVAAGVADLAAGQVIRLLESDDGIDALPIRPEQLWGLRADQILTSEAFGLITSSNVKSETDLDRYSTLLGNSHRTEQEESEFQVLRVRLREHFSLGESQAEREAERIVVRVLDELNSNVNKEQIDFEARQLLQEILRPGRDHEDH